VLTLALLGLLASMAAPLTETVVRRGKEQQLRAAKGCRAAPTFSDFLHLFTVTLRHFWHIP
ncbi:hypothetical protein ACQKO7_12635, partial [Pseudomonas putida]